MVMYVKNEEAAKGSGKVGHKKKIIKVKIELSFLRHFSFSQLGKLWTDIVLASAAWPLMCSEARHKHQPAFLKKYNRQKCLFHSALWVRQRHEEREKNGVYCLLKVFASIIKGTWILNLRPTPAFSNSLRGQKGFLLKFTKENIERVSCVHTHPSLEPMTHACTSPSEYHSCNGGRGQPLFVWIWQ